MMYERPWREGLVGYDPGRVSVVEIEDPDAVSDEDLAAMLAAEGVTARRAYTKENFDESLVVRESGRFATKGGEAAPTGDPGRAATVGAPLREVSRGLDLTPDFATSADGPWGYNTIQTQRALDGATSDAQQVLRQTYGREQADRISDVFRMWSVGAPKWLTGNEGSGGPSGGTAKGHLVDHADVLEARSMVANNVSDDTLYRGAPTRGAANWQPGEEHDLPHESSWSRNPDVAGLFEEIRRGDSTGKTTVMMTMAPGAKGLDIALLGQPDYAWQEETIVAPQRVRVVDSTREGNVVHLNLEAVA